MVLASLTHQKVPSLSCCSLQLREIKLALQTDGIISCIECSPKSFYDLLSWQADGRVTSAIKNARKHIRSLHTLRCRQWHCVSNRTCNMSTSCRSTEHKLYKKQQQIHSITIHATTVTHNSSKYRKLLFQNISPRSPRCAELLQIYSEIYLPLPVGQQNSAVGHMHQTCVFWRYACKYIPRGCRGYKRHMPFTYG